MWLFHLTPIEMVMITEVVGSPSDQGCNPRIRVVMNVGVESIVGGEKKDIPTTDASVTAIHSFSSSAAASAFGDREAEPESSVGLRGFRKRWSSAKSNRSFGSVDPIAQFSPLASPDNIEQFTPNLMSECEEPDEIPSPSGPVMSNDSASRLVNHEFLSNVKWTAFKMPWEMPSAKSVFNPDAAPSIDLRQDPSWGAFATPHPVVDGPKEEAPRRERGEAPVFVNCIRAIKERTFQDMREKQMIAGLEKWNIIVRADSFESRVGRQIEFSPESSLEILRACMGVKSPSTVTGRANAMLSYLRWHTIHFPADKFLPLSENHAWEYVSFLQKSGAPASRASAFIQSCRFAHFVLGIRGADDIFHSGRIVGLSDIQLAGKAVTKQARPLTVFEMQQLHNIASSPDKHLKDKVIASHLLLMAYCRCRHSDTLQIEDVEHDHSEKAGYIQLRTRYHKGSKTATKKSLLLPIVASSAGVGSPEWIQLWWENRVQANLPVSGSLNGPLLPAPRDDEDGWTSRPVTSTEISDILKSFLCCPEDRYLTSHSLKVTTLSWCSKGGVCKEHRRLLGRHSSAVVDADSIYARDLMISPVDSLDRVMSAICEGRFYPDAPRSQYWPLLEPLCRTPVPTAAGQSSALPRTPTMQPQHVTIRNFEQQGERPVKVESDDERSEAVRHNEVVEVSSSSSESEESLPDLLSSSSDEIEDEGEIEEPQTKVPRRLPDLIDEEEVFWKHKQSKIVHSAAAVGVSETTEHVSLCGRRMTKKYEKVQSIPDWTSKCRVCFAGRRQPGSL